MFHGSGHPFCQISEVDNYRGAFGLTCYDNLKILSDFLLVQITLLQLLMSMLIRINFPGPTFLGKRRYFSGIVA